MAGLAAAGMDASGGFGEGCWDIAFRIVCSKRVAADSAMLVSPWGGESCLKDDWIAACIYFALLGFNCLQMDVDWKLLL